MRRWWVGKAPLRQFSVVAAQHYQPWPAVRSPFLRRRAILSHRGLHERLERAGVDLLPLVDVDRPARVAFQAGIEEARWVWEPGPPGERELHDLRVRLPGADDPVVRPDRSAPPFPLLGHLGVGFQD